MKCWVHETKDGTVKAIDTDKADWRTGLLKCEIGAVEFSETIGKTVAVGTTVVEPLWQGG